jgi:hypothetical protein
MPIPEPPHFSANFLVQISLFSALLIGGGCARVEMQRITNHSVGGELYAVRDLRHEPPYAHERVSSNGYIRFPTGADVWFAVRTSRNLSERTDVKLVHMMPIGSSLDVGGIFESLCELSESTPESANRDSEALWSVAIDRWSLEIVGSGFVVSMTGRDLVQDCASDTLQVEVFHHEWLYEYARITFDVGAQAPRLGLERQLRARISDTSAGHELELSAPRHGSGHSETCGPDGCSFIFEQRLNVEHRDESPQVQWRYFPVRYDESPQFSEDDQLMGWSHPYTGRSRDREVRVSEQIVVLLQGDSGPSYASQNHDMMQRERCDDLYNHRTRIEQHNEFGLLERQVFIAFGEEPDAVWTTTETWHWTPGWSSELSAFMQRAMESAVRSTPASQMPIRPTMNRATYEFLMRAVGAPLMEPTPTTSP